MDSGTPVANLVLQIVLYFTAWYLVFFYSSELVLVVYKGIVLPYPARNFWTELLLLFVMICIDLMRIFFGVKGNLTRRKIPLLVSLVFLLPIFFGYLYLILWQTYVFTFEVATLVIAFAGIGLQLVTAPIALWMVHRYTMAR